MSDDWSAAKAEGNAEYGKARFKAAVEAYTRALGDSSIDSTNRATVLCNRAQAQLKMGSFAEAVEDCTSCLTLSPDNVKALYRRGLALEKLKKTDDALKDYNEVLKLNPKQSDALSGLKRLDPAAYKARTDAASGRRKRISKEDAQALAQSQAKVVDVQRQINQLEHKSRSEEAKKRIAQLTSGELDKLEPTATTFMGVGRMYLRKTRDEIKAAKAEEAASASRALEVCSKMQAALKSEFKEAQQAQQEVIRAIESK